MDSTSSWLADAYVDRQLDVMHNVLSNSVDVGAPEIPSFYGPNIPFESTQISGSEMMCCSSKCKDQIDVYGTPSSLHSPPKSLQSASPQSLTQTQTLFTLKPKDIFGTKVDLDKKKSTDPYRVKKKEFKKDFNYDKDIKKLGNRVKLIQLNPEEYEFLVTSFAKIDPASTTYFSKDRISIWADSFVKRFNPKFNNLGMISNGFRIFQSLELFLNDLIESCIEVGGHIESEIKSGEYSNPVMRRGLSALEKSQHEIWCNRQFRKGDNLRSSSSVGILHGYRLEIMDILEQRPYLLPMDFKMKHRSFHNEIAKRIIRDRNSIPFDKKALDRFCRRNGLAKYINKLQHNGDI